MERAFTVWFRDEGLENGFGFQLAIEIKLIADELTVAMSCVLTRPLAEKARQSFQKGGFAAPIPSEKIMRAILQRDIFGDCSEDGVIPDGQSLGERY